MGTSEPGNAVDGSSIGSSGCRTGDEWRAAVRSVAICLDGPALAGRFGKGQTRFVIYCRPSNVPVALQVRQRLYGPHHPDARFACEHDEVSAQRSRLRLSRYQNARR